MRPTILRCLVTAAALAWVPGTGAKAPATTAFYLGGIGVRLPAAVTATRRRGIDFVIHTFTWKRQAILTAYDGTAPTFPRHSPKAARVTARRVGGTEVRTVVWRTRAGRRNRESLVRYGSPDFPFYVHFYYADAAAAQSLQANAIIDSARPY